MSSEGPAFELLDTETRQLRNYAVGFVKMPPDVTTVDPAGSGTLVELRGRRGILTADHVIEKLPKVGKIGIACPLVIREDVFAPKIEMSLCRYHRVGKASLNELGPDIGFLELPSSFAETIGAKKSYFGIDHRRDEGLSILPDDADAWLLCGSAAEWAAVESVDGTPRTFLEWKCGLSTIETYAERAGFDYVTIPARLSDDTHTPNSFQGYSGGGLWRIRISRVDGQLRAASFLCGVAFYETPRVNSDRRVVCHFVKSIYGKTLDTVFAAS